MNLQTFKPVQTLGRKEGSILYQIWQLSLVIIVRYYRSRWRNESAASQFSNCPSGTRRVSVSQDRVEAESRNCIEQQNRITDISNQAPTLRGYLGFSSGNWIWVAALRQSSALRLRLGLWSFCLFDGRNRRELWSRWYRTCAPCDQRSRSPVRDRDRERERE